MIALVRIALTRPYTFVVLALLILIIGPLAALRTPTDIFPDIRIPVISVVWHYTGLPPDEMAGRITTPFQRALTTTVNDIEHIEANSYNGFGIVKIFFQPNVDIRTATAQVTAISQTLLKADAARHDAAADPQLQRLDRADRAAGAVGRRLHRTAAGRHRHQPGAHRRWSPCRARRSPTRIGGKLRQIQIDLDPAALAGQRPVGTGRRQRARRAEPDHAGRHREDRRLRIYGAAQRRALAARRTQRPADQDGRRGDGLHARRRAGARRQSRRRPTSSMSTAIARC